MWYSFINIFCSEVIMHIGLLNDIADIKYTVRRSGIDAPLSFKLDGNPFLGERLLIKWQEIFEGGIDIVVDLSDEYYLGDLCISIGDDISSNDDGMPRKITVYDAEKTRIIASHYAETGKNIAEKNVTLEIYEKIEKFIIEFDYYFSSAAVNKIELYGGDTSDMLVYPTPASIKESVGTLSLSALASITIESELADAAFDAFAEKLYEKVGVKTRRSDNGATKFIFDGTLTDNAYRLKITENSAELYAKDKRGFVYGAENLIKLVSQNGVPAVEIDDAPRMPFRGVHLMLPGRDDMEFAKRFIKYVVSPMGYNAAIIELAGGMKFDSHPEILGAVLNAKAHEKKGEWPHFPHGEPGGDTGVTKAVVADFVDYIRSFGIEPIPEIQSLGHVQFMTIAHPEIAEIAEDSKVGKVDELTADVPPNKFYAHCYCPSNEKSYEILFDLIDEIIEVFRPTEYVHMGHDEVYEIGICPACRDKDPAELLASDINKIYDYLKSKGYKMMIWADMLQPVTKYKTPRAIDLIPKDIVLLDFIWYFHLSKDIEDNLLEKDFKVIYGNVYTSHFPRYESRILKNGIVGAQTSAWVSTSEKEMGKEGKIYEFLLSAEAFWSDRYSGHLRYVYDNKLKSFMPGLRLALRGQKPIDGDELCVYELTPQNPMPANEISIGKVCRALVFEHITSDKITRKPWGPLDTVGNYKITYDDGSTELIPIEYGGNIGHYARRQNEPFKGEYYRHNGYFATYFTDGIEEKSTDGQPITVYRFEWRNPSPDKVIATVEIVNSRKFNTEICLLKLSVI